MLNKLWKEVKDEINDLVKDYDKITFGSESTSLIESYEKIRFNSSIDLPLNTSIKFHAQTVVINCVIEKNDKQNLEIYLDQALFENDKV